MTDKTPESKIWSNIGTEFPDDYNYEEEQRPVDVYDDWFNYTVTSDIDSLFGDINNLYSLFGDLDFYYGNSSQIPDAGEAGRVWFAPDTKTTYLDNGIEWISLGVRKYSNLTNRTHGNEDHTEDYITSGDIDSGAPSPHDNAHHSKDFAVDGETQPPEQHGNEDHSTNYASESDLSEKADETDIPVVDSNDEFELFRIEDTWDVSNGDLTIDSSDLSFSEPLVGHKQQIAVWDTGTFPGHKINLDITIDGNTTQYDNEFGMEYRDRDGGTSNIVHSSPLPNISAENNFELRLRNDNYSTSGEWRVHYQGVFIDKF
jgi:hypothetical protein